MSLIFAVSATHRGYKSSGTYSFSNSVGKFFQWSCLQDFVLYILCPSCSYPFDGDTSANKAGKASRIASGKCYPFLLATFPFYKEKIALKCHSICHETIPSANRDGTPFSEPCPTAEWWPCSIDHLQSSSIDRSVSSAHSVVFTFHIRGCRSGTATIEKAVKVHC